jgi:hypothetical protein
MMQPTTLKAHPCTTAGVFVVTLILLAFTTRLGFKDKTIISMMVATARDGRTVGGLHLPSPSPVSIKPTFAETGTDKLTRHGYHRFYDLFLQPLYGKPVRMLEVGVKGGKSLRSWQNVFDAEHSTIYGVSWPKTVALKAHLGPNVHVMHRDQSNCDHLDDIAATAGAEPLDLVIDDGSHEPSHMLKTLVKLFPRLAPGGFYVIEDVETSYWDRPRASIYGYPLHDVGVGRPGSILSPLHILVEVVNQRYARPDYDRDFHFIDAGVDPDVAWIMFAQNMVVIRKKANEDRAYEAAIDHKADGSTWTAFMGRPDVAAVGQKVREWTC